MDWQVVESGLAAWVAAMTGVSPDLIAWDRAPVGMRKYPQMDLRLFDHRARDGVTPEIVYPEPDDAGHIRPMVVAQRACSWSITMTTRDQRADEKAYVLLDALAVMLELPYTAEVFGALGVVALDMGRVIINSDIPSEHRDLSHAVLTLQLGYVLAVSAPVSVAAAAVDIIEHAEIGGTVYEPDGITPVVIPPKIMPPLPVPSGQVLVATRPIRIGGVPLVITPAGAPP